MNLLTRTVRRCVLTAADRRLISARRAASWLHFIELGRFPNLRAPRDLNEKVMWMEFNTDTSRWSRLSDKFEVRSYVAGKGLEDLLVPLIGLFDSVDEIDFDSLGSDFVIKSTNGSAQSIIVSDKSAVDSKALHDRVSSWFGHRFGFATGEPHYSRIKPRIIVEKRLPVPPGTLPIDYKFMCFNGKARYCLLCTQRNDSDFHCKFNLLYPDSWTEVPASATSEFRGNPDVPRPARLEDMVRYAEILARDFPFVRVDMYEVDGKVYFGELTFTPLAGRIPCLNRKTLLKLGEMLTLPNETKSSTIHHKTLNQS